MADISAHKATQLAEAERWGATGAKIGSRALSSTTMEVARKAVASVAGTKTRVALNESAADVNDLRASPSLRSALEEDMAASNAAVLELMLEAMEDGLDSEMRWQTTQVNGMKWELTAEDSALLPSYPIQGHTSAEISDYMHTQLLYEVAGITAGPLDGSELVSSVPDQLAALVTRFGDRVSAAAKEAYFAGVQLAVRMVAEAITNAD